jgi:hypothetical protein
MILDIVESTNSVPIRLTDERWEHICQHPNMSGLYEAVLDTVKYPEFVLRGHRGAKTAILNIGRRQWLHVNYRELTKKDGFIISAFVDYEYDEDLIIWRRN